jgi:D-alanine--poly(phosphoribitol) ligase subunit 1
MWKYNLGQEFEEVVRRFPDNVAIRIAEEQITYKDLNRLTNQIARFLVSQGFSIGDRICISSEKSIITYASLLACLKAGIAYTFVDRYSPLQRLKKIVRKCNPKAILADPEFFEVKLKDNIQIPVLKTDELSTSLSSFGNEALEITTQVPSTAIAYIMFTSGTTGTPKGVAIPHGNLIHFKEWGIQEYEITDKDTITNVNSLFFDNSVFDVYMSFFSGACLLPMNRSDLKEPGRVVKYLDDYQASIWFSVPSMLIYLLNLHVLKPENFKFFRKIIFGGEGFPKNKLKELYDLYHSRIQLVNVYGPTECTCICSSYLVTGNDFEGQNLNILSPLGKIIDNFYYLILDDDYSLITKGQIGELYLGGQHVATGYFGSAEETESAFVQNPLHQNFRDIIYKTGDLVRVDLNDSKLYFCGRKGRQIKFMGYRIELEEIEAALNGIKNIHECAVTYGKKNGYDEITGFVKSEMSKQEIKTMLKELIPEYMVPRKIFLKDSLPKNANGKVDRKRLSSEYYDREENKRNRE